MVRVTDTDGAGRDVIGCATCHAVHDNTRPFLLRWSGSRGMIVACASCHPDAVGDPVADAAAAGEGRWSGSSPRTGDRP